MKEDEMSEKLKQCPFCNGEFAFDFEAKNFRCGTCGATVPPDPYARTVNTRPIEDELNKRIAELEAERRWRIIADGEMPDDRATVLVAFTEYPEQIDILTATYYKHYEGFGGVDNWWDIEGWHSGNVTHWKPLPEPPNDTQKETLAYGKDSKPLPCPFCGEIVKECNDVATPIDVALRKRIAELEKDNDEFRQLIHDWIIILTPDDGYGPDSEGVRQAMLVIDKERER